MVSVAVVGPAMSGKTHLCVMLAGIPATVAPSIYNETCGVNYLKTDVNAKPWHIWDTPSYVEVGWAAVLTVEKAHVIVVCHDGRRSDNPYNLVRQFGADRCVIALTRTPLASANLSYVVDHLRTTTSRGTLVPIVDAHNTVGMLISKIQSIAAQQPADLDILV